MKTLVKHRHDCRVCRGSRLTKVLSFGTTPLANAFVTRAQQHEPELFFPLSVSLCRDCGLLQLQDIVSPTVLFTHYFYASSTSPVFRAHFEEFATAAVKRFELASQALIVDIGSNDGILLKPFLEAGCRVLGIDPAKNLARVARRQGIPTEIAFFSKSLAGKLVKRHGRAEIITATNVFAHIDDLDEIVAGVKVLLKPRGTLIVEVPYLVDFIEQNIFDTVYHEHLSYFSLAVLEKFFARHGLMVWDVEKVATHGGSLRVYVKRRGQKACARVSDVRRRERAHNLASLKTYADYAQRIDDNKLALLALLHQLKRQGKTIAGYGAPAKGTTLLNVFGIGADILEYIVDDSPLKQGTFTPGKRIPVVSSAYLDQHPPDYLLLIAWNFAQPIMAKHRAFAKAGGKFILPIPTPQVL